MKEKSIRYSAMITSIVNFLKLPIGDSKNKFANIFKFW